MNSILVTGGAGFIGSNFILYMLQKYPGYRLVNLDKMTYAGNPENLRELAGKDGYHFVRGDISNRELVSYIFETFDITGVVHLAAESHVDNSITGPEVFIQSNVHGTFILLDIAMRRWMDIPAQPGKGLENRRFLHVSTDEVYGSLGPEGLFSETTPYAPNSPYSASKAGSDMLVRSYHHTFGLNTVITNCSNNYGPRQHDEKLIPTIIRSALENRPIPIYGQGLNVRDWLYVMDHCRGIDLAFHQGRPGQTYNIGFFGFCKSGYLTGELFLPGVVFSFYYSSFYTCSAGPFKGVNTVSVRYYQNHFPFYIPISAGINYSLKI